MDFHSPGGALLWFELMIGVVAPVVASWIAPLLFAATVLWLAVVFLRARGMAVSSGWRDLASRFGTSRCHGRRVLSTDYACVGTVNFGHRLLVSLDTDSLSFALPFPFSIYCRPISIPFDSIISASYRDRVRGRIVALELEDTRVVVEVAASLLADTPK
jgi:hypothetical protein